MKTLLIQGQSIRILSVVFWLVVVQLSALPQDRKRNLIVEGYLSSLQTGIAYDSLNGIWQMESQIQNRLHVNYVLNSHFQAVFQERTRLIAGDRFSADPGGMAGNSFAMDPGFLDLAFNWSDGRSYIFNTAMDRLWVQYSGGKTEITLGRQRINWGQTLVWNPNDWFNNFSFFDVDYVERPGSDALSIRHFSGPVAGQEMVLSADSSGRITAAIRTGFNFRGYDIQLLGGWLREEDLAMGAGWSGQIGRAGFRGEISYFHPSADPMDTSGVWLASINVDYTFSNSVCLVFEGFYDQTAVRNPIRSFTEFTSRPLSVKDLSFTDWNILLQASGRLTPLLTASLAMVYYPGVRGMYIAPSFDYSLGDNLVFSCWLQHFSGKFPGQDRQQITLGLMRFKYSF